MAQRRMIDKDFVLSNNYLTMNNASQILYIRLLVSADDEGFVANSRLFVRRPSVLRELVTHELVYCFDGGLLLLRHWHVHNKIRKDMFKPTVYQAEKALVTLGSDNIYYLNSVTETDQSRTENVTQDSIGKDSIGKDSAGKEKDQAACGAARDIDFENFWKLYPCKVGKEDARAVFYKTDVPVQIIMEGLQNHINSHRWLSDDGKFIPNPANWLSKRQWEDRLPPEHPPSGAAGGLGKEELAAIQRALAEAK